jgi:hypothetical protein
METLGEESRLGVGHGAETADESTCDDALLALKDADLEMWSCLGSESLPECRQGRRGCLGGGWRSGRSRGWGWTWGVLDL